MKGNSAYKKNNMKIWNEVAPRYHKRWLGKTRGPLESTRKLIEHLDVKRDSDVLDAACGTGFVTKRLACKVGRGGSMVAADISASAIKIAQRYNRCNPNILFVNADIENFAVSKKFDIITCQYALFYFPNALKALKNMRNCLKKTGRLGISVHGSMDKVPFFSSIYDAVEKFIPEHLPAGAPDLGRYSTKGALKAEVKRSGFSKISIHDYTFRYSPGSFEDYWSNYLRYVAKPVREKLAKLDRSQKREIRKIVKENTGQFTDKRGIIRFPWQVLILTARY